MKELQNAGWSLESDTVYAPSRRLWLSPAHFDDWSPTQMHSVFVGRARQIEQKIVGKTLEQIAQENHQIHRAIERLGWAEPDIVSSVKHLSLVSSRISGAAPCWPWLSSFCAQF